jgi:ribonuclease BN (tRNA processing enzyme)
LTVLASGSQGNASLLESGGFGVLVDLGLGPRQLGQRLALAGTSWARIQAVLLTHTHRDHWNPRTMGWLLRRRVPIVCHAAHAEALRVWSPAFRGLELARLVRIYDDEPFALCTGLQCRPIAVKHDGGPTFGFRFEAAGDLFSMAASCGYAADLGCWDTAIAQALANVDLLAIEFNHDVAMQRASGRSAFLIDRVLGDEGHLSNEQAAKLLAATMALSPPGKLKHVVQLHLSRECNRPTLAIEAARAALTSCTSVAEVHTARQDTPLATVGLEPSLAAG